MKLFYLLTILFFLIGCSFDNKSGIWKNESQLSSKNKDLFKDMRSLWSFKEIEFSNVSKYFKILFLSDTKSFSIIVFNDKIE